MTNIDEIFIKANFDEAKQSQLPFVELLINMDWEYLSRAELEDSRDGKSNIHVLTNIAFESLNKINSYEFQGHSYKFSKSNVLNAIYDLENRQYMGLCTTSREIYSDLVGGRDLREFVDGNDQSFSFRYFDFDNVENNRFQLSVEVVSQGVENIRADIILYVNGIPLAIVENKKSSVNVDAAVSQLLDYQGANRCPKLFLFACLLIGTNKSEFKYGTTGTPKKFYSVWKNEDLIESVLLNFISKKIDDDVYEKVLNDLNGNVFGHKQITDRMISEQDRGVFSMLSKVAILDIFRNYVLFDGDDKKVARYQQVRAVDKTIKRVLNLSSDSGKRKGGLIWHTQGSGKSLTMVMLAKAIFSNKNISNPRVIIVTDRKQLDEQIKETFINCKLKYDVIKSSSSSDLVKLLKSHKSQVITTLVHKFDRAFVKNQKYKDEDSNIFIFIDEAHRTQDGNANNRMQMMLPNACTIAFTGTPIMKDEKSKNKYGGYIDKYTIDDAIRDENVLKLIYEERTLTISQCKDLTEKKIDEDPKFKELTADQKKCLQRDLRVRTILEVHDVIEDIANNIFNHFKENAFSKVNGEANGFKGQIVTASKYSAILFHEYFEYKTDIKTAVVISDEIIREEDTNSTSKKEKIKKFLNDKKSKYGSLERYEKNVIDSFIKNDEGIQILIVVDKLLTGFDAPRNTFLYLAKELRDHNLLQAIARVNRLFSNDKEVKTAGYIIDYSKNYSNLSFAMGLFSNYDPSDVVNVFLDIDKMIEETRKSQREVADIFKTVKNKNDDEEYVICLENEAIRNDFYKKVNNFTKIFSEVCVLKDFCEKFGINNVESYKKELSRFLSIKKSANDRYADHIDLSDYKEKIFRVLEGTVSVDEIKQTIRPIDILNIQDRANLKNEENKKGIAETMASQIRRTLIILMPKDDVYYKKFYEKIEEIIIKIKTSIDFDSLIKEMEEISEKIANKTDDTIPNEIRQDPVTEIFYRNTEEFFDLSGSEKIKIIIMITKFFKANLVVDWTVNNEIKRRIKNKLDDYIYNTFKINVPNEMLERVMTLAENNKGLFSVR